MRSIDHDARYKTMLFSKILGITFNYSADNFCFDLSFTLPIFQLYFWILSLYIFYGNSSGEVDVLLTTTNFYAAFAKLAAIYVSICM